MTQEKISNSEIFNPFLLQNITGEISINPEVENTAPESSNPFLLKNLVAPEDYEAERIAFGGKAQLHAPDAVQAAEDTEAQARRVLSYTLGKSQDAAVTAFKVREGKGIPTYTSLEDEKLATGAARELALEAMGDFSTDTVQVLGDLDCASLIHTEVPLADQFNKLLSAPADLFHEGIETCLLYTSPSPRDA